MPLATPEQYRAMLDAAHDHGYTLPSVNVSSSSTLNAALRGFAEAGSDGIAQMTPGAAGYASGAAADVALGARAMAALAHVLAERQPTYVALHTDHCPPAQVDAFIRPLLAESTERRTRGEPPLFHSHMFDGSSLSLDENLATAAELLELCRAADVVLELEIGLVGGEEDGIDNRSAGHDRFYSTPEDALAVAARLGTGDRGRYLLAATFGNVHGVYSAVNARLRPEILGTLQAAVAAAVGRPRPFQLVFHGGSGSTLEQIREAISHGVVKMNLDTDLMYAYTRAVADHVLRHYDDVLKVDGRFGSKQHYDPRAWGRRGEAAMAARVVEACEQLGSAGRSLAGATPGSAKSQASPSRL